MLDEKLALATGLLRVMVVDDSAVVRKAMGDALEGLEGVQLICTAPNGRIALAKLEHEQVDLCLVDLEMPEMDGIAFVTALRRRHPEIRILIVTASSELSRRRAVEALTLGATDLVLKPEGLGGNYQEQVVVLRERLAPGLLALKRQSESPRHRPAGALWPKKHPRLVVVGVSTGGPEALARFLPALPADFPWPIAVVQHMPPGFTQALAQRLAGACTLAVREAQDGEALKAGTVLIAPGGQHLEVLPEGQHFTAKLTQDPPESSCRPSVNVLFRSAAKASEGALVGLVLTGMGYDGSAGGRVLKAAGGSLWAQDQASSVVWGMPGGVVSAGLADEVLPLEGMASALCALAGCRPALLRH